MPNYKALLLKVLSYETDIDWLIRHEDFSDEEQTTLQELYAEANVSK